ncbi:flavin monoamine oxidase family protein [Nocardia fluminea]|uniref:flavin monoamine oxidase family protein n=1 Tax=Nocardia fluminea TaxID=134984 RepID=UPI00371AE7BB
MSTIVIGAGLAGLAAARKLTQAGEEVVVLEAQPYVGGRTRSDRDRLGEGRPADLGASFIDIGQDKVLAYCDELELELTPAFPLFPTAPGGRLTAASPLRSQVVLDGQRVDDWLRDQLAAEVHAALDAIAPTSTETVSAWTARSGLSPDARRLFCAQTGFNPVHVAAQVPMSMLEPPHIGRVCWMLADGTDSIARKLAESLDIRLGQPARLVRRTRGRIEVDTDTDTFTGYDVVVATPVTPTLRIGFDPVLPPWKIDALLSTPMTQGGKVVARYADGEEIVARIVPSVLSDGPITLAWARPVAADGSVTVLGLAADRADGFLRDEASALAALDQLIGTVLGRAPRRLGGIVQDWTQEQYAGGVVSILLADFPRLPSLLAQGVGPVHFAGEHTAEMWATSMDGALRSGERAADEVLLRRRIRAGRVATS